ncbi:signal recognition particle 14 kDa protein-like [Octodon degus]|uniref:Signal recognition particle 14 kDa protein n=1 Tax=Octodon degus TaxID=10160 RepID=A0A6P3VCI9_OCTDE|nr:signal recognition particle 14 kDa protein-like [Octodon degus]
MLLESEQLLTELTRLFQKCRTSGSVFLSLKKYDGHTRSIPKKGSVEGVQPEGSKCLLRATDGEKKISTVGSSTEVSKFQMAYFNLLRANMDRLKKRDKKNKNKRAKHHSERLWVLCSYQSTNGLLFFLLATELDFWLPCGNYFPMK